MAKTKEVTGEISLGTDNWNVADGYTKLKILRQLVMLDRWDTIAQFGTEELEEDRNFTHIQINQRRVEALQRFHSTLKQLIQNVWFALKKDDIPKVRGYVTRLDSLREFLPKAYRSEMDNVAQEEIFDIHEDLFRGILDILQDIKENVNIALNNASLIFRASEEVDLDKIMNEIIEGG